jgi:hypothetical protein
MLKNEAIKILVQSAKNYYNNLANKQVLIIYKDDSGYQEVELLFLPTNFLHLTGAETKLSPIDFYTACLNSRLNADDFGFRSDGTTVLKLSVLITMTNLSQNIKMIGDCSDSYIKLKTDKLAGTVRACMGFIKIFPQNIKDKISLKKDSDSL